MPLAQPTRLFDFIFYQQEHGPLQRSLAERHEGSLSAFSTEQVIDLASRLAAGLLQRGFRRGERVAMVSYRNRPEWLLLDLGIQMAGLVSVPVYPTISAADYAYIFRESGVRLAFVGSGDLYDKVSRANADGGPIETIYTFDRHPEAPIWSDLMLEAPTEAVAESMERVGPDDLATIIYTSGTTGLPKGVMLSHRNIVSNVLAVADLSPALPGELAVSFLPLCHVFERTASYYYQYLGVELVLVGLDNLGGPEGDLATLRPHHFNTVPRLLEKVNERIMQRGSALPPPLRWLFQQAVRFTGSYEYDRSYRGLDRLRYRLFDRLVYAKWREALGGRVKGIVTGAAACPESILRFFSAAGIPVREGYGLTETSPGLAIGRFDPGGAKIGTVGPPLQGVALQLDTYDEALREGEGEILAHGPNVMLGYYQQAEATEQVFVEIEGKRWLRTGDIGRFVKGPAGEPFLKITDRKKELLKTSGGKYVAPAPIEGKLKEHLLVDQAMVVGDGLKFVSALLVPSPDLLQSWCADHQLDWTRLEEMVRQPAVRKAFQDIVDEVNAPLSHTEQIKKFILLGDTWDARKNDGAPAELTPTLKLKRRVILDKYAKAIAALYA